MENQHRKINGYRELSQEEIDLMNDIKSQGAALEAVVLAVDSFLYEDNQKHGTPDAESRRWLETGKTDVQKGLMALTRAVARPSFF